MKKIIFLGVLLSTMSFNSLWAADSNMGQTKAAACGACHGADGNSAVATFPKLAGQNPRYIVKQLQDIKTGRRVVPAMTGLLDNVTEEDMQDLAAYYADQKPTVGAAKKDLLDLGAKVYRGGNAKAEVTACIACHSPTGKGNAEAGYPAISGQHADYIAAQLKAFRAAGRNDQVADAQKRTNDGDLRMMRDVAAGLSDLEIEAVSSYISGLH